MSLQAVKGHLPGLSQLHLKFWRPERPMTMEMFSIAPRLKTLVIDNVINWNSGVFCIRVIVPLHRSCLQSHWFMPEG